MRCLHVSIHGEVQGVGYRYACQLQAERLGIIGWVRNCHDGTVEACISGSDEALAAMQSWLERGPTMARVDRVIAEEVSGPENLRGFSVLPADKNRFPE